MKRPVFNKSPNPFDPAKFRVAKDYNLGPDQTITVVVPKKILDSVDAFVAEGPRLGLSDRNQIFVLGAITLVRQQQAEDANSGFEVAEEPYSGHERCPDCGRLTGSDFRQRDLAHMSDEDDELFCECGA